MASDPDEEDSLRAPIHPAVSGRHHAVAGKAIAPLSALTGAGLKVAEVAAAAGGMADG